MRTVTQFDESIPAYALSFLVNGDSSGLTSEDAANIDKWLAIYETSPDVWMDVSPKDSDEYFTWSPPFGLPCTVVDCTVTIFVEDQTP